MQSFTLIFLAAIVAVALAEGQYYVPRAYYTIDSEGHASAPIPLRRYRRSLNPYYNPGNAGATASANANAVAWGGNANANAQATASARGNSGGWGLPLQAGYSASKPLGAGEFARQSGPIAGGRSVTSSSSVGLDSSGAGYYDQYTSVSN